MAGTKRERRELLVKNLHARYVLARRSGYKGFIPVADAIAYTLAMCRAYGRAPCMRMLYDEKGAPIELVLPAYLMLIPRNPTKAKWYVQLLYGNPAGLLSVYNEGVAALAKSLDLDKDRIEKVAPLIGDYYLAVLSGRSDVAERIAGVIANALNRGRDAVVEALNSANDVFKRLLAAWRLNTIRLENLKESLPPGSRYEVRIPRSVEDFIAALATWYENPMKVRMAGVYSIAKSIIGDVKDVSFNKEFNLLLEKIYTDIDKIASNDKMDVNDVNTVYKILPAYSQLVSQIAKLVSSKGVYSHVVPYYSNLSKQLRM